MNGRGPAPFGGDSCEAQLNRRDDQAPSAEGEAATDSGQRRPRRGSVAVGVVGTEERRRFYAALQRLPSDLPVPRSRRRLLWRREPGRVSSPEGDRGGGSAPRRRSRGRRSTCTRAMPAGSPPRSRGRATSFAIQRSRRRPRRPTCASPRAAALCTALSRPGSRPSTAEILGGVSTGNAQGVPTVCSKELADEAGKRATWVEDGAGRLSNREETEMWMRDSPTLGGRGGRNDTGTALSRTAARRRPRGPGGAPDRLFLAALGRSELVGSRRRRSRQQTERFTPVDRPLTGEQVAARHNIFDEMALKRDRVWQAAVGLRTEGLEGPHRRTGAEGAHTRPRRAGPARRRSRRNGSIATAASRPGRWRCRGWAFRCAVW